MTTRPTTSVPCIIVEQGRSSVTLVKTRRAKSMIQITISKTVILTAAATDLDAILGKGHIRGQQISLE